MKKPLVFVLLTIIALSPLASAEEKSPAKLEKVRLQLKWLHQFNFAGYYAAVEKGFYRDAGLDVTIAEGHPGMNFIDEVVSGRAEYGVEMPELLIARNQGKPVVVLAVIFQHSPQIILARADSNIHSPQDLSGRKVMWRLDSSAELRAMLISEGVDLDSLKIMELSWDINDLIDGKVDAIHAYITDQPLELKKRGIESIILKPIKYGVDFYGDCLFTSEKELSEHPERVRAFRRASLRGWEYAMKNPEEIMDVIQNNYKSKSTREYMLNEFKCINKLMLPDLVEIGHINSGRWKRIADTYVELGMMDGDYSLDGFIYDPDQKADYHYLLVLLGVLGGVFVAGFSGYLINRHLRNLVANRTAELEESRKLYRAIVQDQTELIYRSSSDFTLTFVNDAYCRYFGKKKEELIGQTFLQFVLEDQKNVVKEDLKSLTRDDPVKEWLYQVGLPNGETAWISWTNHAIFDDDGLLVEFQGVGRDITEKKNSREKLLASEQQLRAANQQLLANDQQLRAANQQLYMTQVSVDKAAFEAYWITEDACFSYVNDQACSSLGFSRQELLKLSVCDIDQEYVRQIWDKHWQELKTKKKLTFQSVHVRKDKSTYPAELTVNYLEYDGVGYNIAFAQDITERQKAEELLRESQIKYKRLFNEMTSGAALHEIICDSYGKPVDYRFLDVNPAFEKLTGLAAEDIVGKTVLEIMPDTEPEWIEKYGDVAISGNSIFFENYSHVLSKHYEVRAYSPQAGHFAVIFHDVTERKKGEIEREELLKTLEAKNSELQSVVYTVSHDLKSPLVNIKGFSGVLLEAVDDLKTLMQTEMTYEAFKAKAEKLFNEEVHQSVEFIVSSTDKMKVLLNGLLAVSRVGSSEIYIEKLNITERLQEVLKSMQFQLDENHAEINIGDLPDCMGDADQVSRVFTNLIDNAIKYRSLDRKFVLQISGCVEGGKSVYRIEDNGIGISDNHMSKIFELFHRLNPNDGVEGQGIGLTIVKRILQRLNGDIRLESVYGKGTTFYVELPSA
ncbi:MAG: ABC transporter substrate-binding protein [Phycisphaerae bacterium]|nr:ABC transporter substrate-binding protein [Phycisphaerae bacterium]